MKSFGVLLTACCFYITGCVQKPVESAIEKNREPASVRKLASESVVSERCVENKLYLEDQMQRMPPEYFQLHAEEQQNRIPIKCIQFAQRNYRGHYGICSGEEGKPAISEVKPCLTENYVMLAYNAYHDVMDCFNLDPRDFYLQIMIESGFHLNAINKTGFDSGMAQFTGNGIKKVSANNLIERTHQLLLESSRASCQRISSIVGTFNSDAFTVQKRCALLSLPKNPYRGMFFNYLHTMLDQILLERMLTDLPELKEALTVKVKRQLTYLAYNRGLMGVKRLLAAYVQSRKYFSYQITANDLDLNKNLSRAKKIMQLEPEKRQLLKKARVRNLSFAEYAVINGASYVSDMSAARDYVKRYLGDSCGEL
jgi:hypothetical protein